MTRCKDKIEVTQYGLLTDEYQCALEAGHPGPHIGKNKELATVTWVNASALRSRVENEYKPLT